MQHAKAIQGMLEQEAQKKRWCQINYSTCPPHGGNPTAIQVQTSTGTTKCNTEESVFHHAMKRLSICFRLAYSALCYSNQLLDKIGHFGDTQCTQDILDGTYTFPPDTGV